MKKVVKLTKTTNSDMKNKKKRMAVLCFFFSIIIVVAIGMTVYGQLSSDKNKLITNRSERTFNILQTEFGEKYKTELENMKGVSFYLKKDSKSDAIVLKIKSEDSIDNNIVLVHMVYTNINQIFPESDVEKVAIIAYDVQGTFFDTTDEKSEFTQAFCREDYIAAVEKKEKMLYNFPVRTQ